MLRSLVGSEMCIRDRSASADIRRHKNAYMDVHISPFLCPSVPLAVHPSLVLSCALLPHTSPSLTWQTYGGQSARARTTAPHRGCASSSCTAPLSRDLPKGARTGIRKETYHTQLSHGWGEAVSLCVPPYTSKVLGSVLRFARFHRQSPVFSVMPLSLIHI